MFWIKSKANATDPSPMQISHLAQRCGGVELGYTSQSSVRSLDCIKGDAVISAMEIGVYTDRAINFKEIEKLEISVKECRGWRVFAASEIREFLRRSKNVK